MLAKISRGGGFGVRNGDPMRRKVSLKNRFLASCAMLSSVGSTFCGVVVQAE